MKDEYFEFVIMIDDKYYYKHTDKRLVTSYSITGARLFNSESNWPFILDTEDFLMSKGYEVKRKSVKLFDL